MNTAKLWDYIHNISDLQYPGESVVRFLFRNFPKDRDKRKNLKILDLGCGSGRHVKLFAEQGFDVSGVDISKDGLSQTSEMLRKLNLQADLKLADANDLPYPDGYFDGAVSYAVLYYNDREGMAIKIKELHRVLKKGGRAMFYIKTTDDYYFAKGQEVAKNTFIMDGTDESKKGMTLHFLTREDVYDVYSIFKNVSVEKEEFTSYNLQMLNSHWAITVEA